MSSFIYKNILFYRFTMNLLYKGNYTNRFDSVCEQIQGKTVTELCFGDTIIAAYCKKKGISWQGFDINRNFVNKALEKGFSAKHADIRNINLPSAETVIICGSLYHFHDQLEKLLTQILVASSRIIISEPVINLSSRKGIIGKLAKGSAAVEGEEQHFRFSEKTLLAEMERLSQKLSFKYEIAGRISKDIVIIITQ